MIALGDPGLAIIVVVVVFAVLAVLGGLAVRRRGVHVHVDVDTSDRKPGDDDAV